MIKLKEAKKTMNIDFLASFSISTPENWVKVQF